MFLLLPLLLTGPTLSEDPPADTLLLDAMLLFLNEKTAVDGADRLGSTGDPRAIVPLSHAARTAELPVALAATRNLAHYPDAFKALGELLGSNLPHEVQIEAARALGLLGSEAAATALLDALRRDLPRPVRVEVITTLRTRYPERSTGLAPPVRQDGWGWLMAGGAESLGFTMAAAGHFGKADMEALGGWTGAAAGGSLGYLGAKRWPMEAEDAAFITTNGFAGTLSGILIGDSLSSTSSGGWIGGLSGELLGYGLGFGLRERHKGTVSDAWESTALSFGTTLGAGTLSYFLSEQDEETLELVIGLGIAGGMVGGDLLAPRVDLSGRDFGLIALSSTWGIMAGGLVPIGSRDRLGLPWTGFALSGLVGYGLSEPLDLGGDVIFGGFTGLGYGSLMGVGVGALIDLHDYDIIKASTLIGGSLGLGAGSLLAWENPAGVQANDVVLTASTTAWATWQIVGWFTVVDSPNTDLAGLTPLIPASVGALTAIASPKLDIGVERSLPTLSLGLWGAYAGASLGVLTRAREPLAWSLVASDLGLGAGALLMSPLIDAPPIVVGMADAGGVLGVSAGALGAAFVTRDRDAILIASLVGAGVGAAGGTGLGYALQRDRGLGKTAMNLPFLPDLPDLPGTWSLMPASFPDRETAAWGARLQVLGW